MPSRSIVIHASADSNGDSNSTFAESPTATSFRSATSGSLYALLVHQLDPPATTYPPSVVRAWPPRPSLADRRTSYAPPRSGTKEYVSARLLVRMVSVRTR